MWLPALVRVTMPALWRIPRCFETFCCEAPRALLKLADGRVCLAQAVEQLDPHRLAEYPEALGDQLDQRLRKGMWNGWKRAHVIKSSTSAQLCS